MGDGCQGGRGPGAHLRWSRGEGPLRRRRHGQGDRVRPSIYARSTQCAELGGGGGLERRADARGVVHVHRLWTGPPRWSTHSLWSRTSKCPAFSVDRRRTRSSQQLSVGFARGSRARSEHEDRPRHGQGRGGQDHRRRLHRAESSRLRSSDIDHIHRPGPFARRCSCRELGIRPGRGRCQSRRPTNRHPAPARPLLGLDPPSVDGRARLGRRRRHRGRGVPCLPRDGRALRPSRGEPSCPIRPVRRHRCRLRPDRRDPAPALPSRGPELVLRESPTRPSAAS